MANEPSFIITWVNPEIELQSLAGRTYGTGSPEAMKFPFRLYDDDGILYFEGKSDQNFVFDPLDTIGASTGCTCIKFLDGDVFVTA